MRKVGCRMKNYLITLCSCSQSRILQSCYLLRVLSERILKRFKNRLLKSWSRGQINCAFHGRPLTSQIRILWVPQLFNIWRRDSRTLYTLRARTPTIINFRWNEELIWTLNLIWFLCVKSEKEFKCCSISW